VAISNAGLVWLYVVYDLTLFQLVVVYWLECLWIGFFSALQLITASVIGNPWENQYAELRAGGSLFLTFMSLFYLSGAFFAFAGGLGLAVFLVPAEIAGADSAELLREGARAIMVGAVMLSIGHGLSFVINFLILGDYRYVRAGSLLVWPFRRCLTLLVAILVALAVLALLPQFADKTSFAVMLILLKLAADFRVAARRSISQP